MKTFNEVEIEKLKKNKYVKNVTQKTITYTDEFKKHFLELYKENKSPKKTMEILGFDKEIIGQDRIDNIAKNLKKNIKTNIDEVKELKEKNKQLEQQLELKDQTIEFLKKNILLQETKNMLKAKS